MTTTTTTAREAVFYVLSRNLAAGVNAAYNRLELGEQTPRIRYGHGLFPPGEGAPCIVIALTSLTPVPMTLNRCAVIPRVGYQLELWRPWPPVDARGNVNHLAEAETSELLRADADALFEMTQLCAEGVLIAGLPDLRCDAFTFSELRPLGPLGDLAGWRLLVNVDLFGTPLLMPAAVV